MKNLARGSVFFGILALIVAMFYLQPHVEAALVIASEAQNSEQLNIGQIIQKEENQFTLSIYTPTDSLTSGNNVAEKAKNSSEAGSEARAFKATAYCLKGRTASGSGVRRGIVAADPRVLPLGTRIQLQAGSYSGTYTVADTGGVVKGRILDVWVPSCAEAKRFGRKNVKVSVLGKKKRR